MSIQMKASVLQITSIYNASIWRKQRSWMNLGMEEHSSCWESETKEDAGNSQQTRPVSEEKKIDNITSRWSWIRGKVGYVTWLNTVLSHCSSGLVYPLSSTVQGVLIVDANISPSQSMLWQVKLTNFLLVIHGLLLCKMDTVFSFTRTITTFKKLLHPAPSHSDVQDYSLDMGSNGCGLSSQILVVCVMKQLRQFYLTDNTRILPRQRQSNI